MYNCIYHSCVWCRYDAGTFTCTVNELIIVQVGCRCSGNKIQYLLQILLFNTCTEDECDWNHLTSTCVREVRSQLVERVTVL